VNRTGEGKGATYSNGPRPIRDDWRGKAQCRPESFSDRAYGRTRFGTVSAMSPRGRKVGGIDDPIWGGDAPGKDAGESTSESGGSNPGSSGNKQPKNPNRNSASTKVERDMQDRRGAPSNASPQPNAQGLRGAPSNGGPPTRSAQPTSGPQNRNRSPSNDGFGGGAQDIPRRILVEDPKIARDDERECEVEGWFQTDDGVPVSSALRPLSVACARPWGHAGHHRSKPRRAYFRSGRVWVYEWGMPKDSPDG
jgi:hypothetical protein